MEYTLVDRHQLVNKKSAAKGDNWMPAWAPCAGRLVQVTGSHAQFQPGSRVSTIGPLVDRFRTSAALIQPIPAGLPGDAGPFWGLSHTVLNLIYEADIQLGETVLVVGEGAFARLGALMALKAGALKVAGLASGPVGSNFPKLKPPIPWFETFRAACRFLNSREVDVILDFEGNAGQIMNLLPHLKENGRAISLPLRTNPPLNINLYPDLHRRSLTLKSITFPPREFRFGSRSSQEVEAYLLDLLEESGSFFAREFLEIIQWEGEISSQPIMVESGKDYLLVWPGAEMND